MIAYLGMASRSALWCPTLSVSPACVQCSSKRFENNWQATLHKKSLPPRPLLIHGNMMMTMMKVRGSLSAAFCNLGKKFITVCSERLSIFGSALCLDGWPLATPDVVIKLWKPFPYIRRNHSFLLSHFQCIVTFAQLLFSLTMEKEFTDLV